MQQVLTATQNCEVHVLSLRDPKGNPANVENPVWASSDESILLLILDPSDPLKVTASAVGPVGAALVTLRADADLGEGVQEIIGTMDFVVIAGRAVALELEAGPPTEQAPPAASRRR